MTTRATSHFLLVLALLCLCRPAAADPQNCTRTLEGLAILAGDSPFPLRWEETSMTDGKPLVVSITEKDGALFLAFNKTHEGLWAEGPAVVCRMGAALEARIGRIRIGPAAHWILRQSMAGGSTFALSRRSAGQLQIATPGWKGDFAAKPN
ncbi:hypothetical protein [Ramlibacter sp. WS9]|uniref:hypothetical protein n=1 Tax=Ramlibacter sp. WS9 TaxID=1882741 RepID=UPI0011431672|nr:hypothetical protein [Ramlibacter sp. WS9]ROZ76999.1 hypothetical protein EEB15_10450 [Ramlibacter sp. WS9]